MFNIDGRLLAGADWLARKAKRRSNTSGLRLAVDAGILATMGGVGAHFFAETPYEFGGFPSWLVVMGFPAFTLLGAWIHWRRFNIPARREEVLVAVARLRKMKRMRLLFLLIASSFVLSNPHTLSSANVALAIAFLGAVSAFYLMCTERGWEVAPGLLPRR